MKNILITGASKGIGQAIAVKLAGKDSHIFIHGRDKQGLEVTSNAIEKKAGKATQIIADISTPAGCDKIILRVGKTDIDILIHNAAIAVVKPLEELTLDDWNKTFAVNVTAPFLITQKLLSRLKKGSSIVNILSVAAKKSFSEWSSYCMSKHAMRGFTESIRQELRPKGIRVINIFPAAVDTPIWDNVAGDWEKSTMLSADDIARAVEFAISNRDRVMIDDITMESILRG